jgi:alpha-glucosidase
MTWWQRGSIYEIYPRSFQDSDGDGVGDLRGITARLPYVRNLGVDAIWLTPIYRSPQADFGYDITDHTAIDPQYGSLDDFDALVARAHALGLKVLLDYVPNHTSDQHPWFAENPDWYYWRDEPNNWRAVFGGSAWEAVGDRHYLHTYLREQPDLNWRNPAVREAMLDVLRFWLDRGVDGFRVDALRQLLKDPDWRDNPPNPDWDGANEYDSLLPVHTTDLDELQELVAAIRQAIGDKLMVAEVYVAIERLVRYYGENGRGAQLPFNFHLISTPWDAEAIAELVERYEAALPPGAWPNWVLGNHDRPRIAGRVGPAQARVAAMLLLTLRGTPTLYYGDELGMRDVPIPAAKVQDPWERRVPASAATPCGRRCRGRTPTASPAPSRGCRSATSRPSPSRSATPARRSRSTGACSRCAAPRTRLRRGRGRGCAPARACWPTSAAAASSSRSTSPARSASSTCRPGSSR